MSSVALLGVDGWVELGGRAVCLVYTRPCVQFSQNHVYQKMAFLYILCHFWCCERLILPVMYSILFVLIKAYT